MIHIQKPDPVRLSRQAEIFKALSSPARLAILAVLEEGPLSVNDLVDRLVGLQECCSPERTNVSKHLAMLRELGLVSVEGDAQRRIYRLKAKCLLEAVRCTESLTGDTGCAADCNC